MICFCSEMICFYSEMIYFSLENDMFVFGKFFKQNKGWGGSGSDEKEEISTIRLGGKVPK